MASMRSRRCASVQAAQVGTSILGHDHARVSTGLAGRPAEPGHDPAGGPAVDGQGDHRNAAVGPGRAAQEVGGAAHCADVPAGGGLGIDLSGEVNLE